MRDVEARLASLEARVRGVEDVEVRVAALEQAVWQHWGREHGASRTFIFRIHGIGDLVLSGADVVVEWPGGRRTGTTDAAGEAPITISMPASGTVACNVTIRKPTRWKEWTASAEVSINMTDVNIYIPTGAPGFDWADYIVSGYHVLGYDMFADPTSSNLVFEDPLHGDVSLTNSGVVTDTDWTSGSITLDHPGGGGCGAVDNVPATVELSYDIAYMSYTFGAGCPTTGGPPNVTLEADPNPSFSGDEPQSWTVEFDADPWWAGVARTVRIREA